MAGRQRLWRRALARLGTRRGPEFVEGRLPGMILAQGPDVWPPPVQEPPQSGLHSGPTEEPWFRTRIRSRSCRRPIRSSAGAIARGPGVGNGRTAVAAADPELLPARIGGCTSVCRGIGVAGGPGVWQWPGCHRAARAWSHGALAALAVFPAAADAVEWTRGSYTLLERGGRVEVPRAQAR